MYGAKAAFLATSIWMAPVAEIAETEIKKQMTRQLYFKTKPISDPPGLISRCYFSGLSQKALCNAGKRKVPG